MVIDLYTTILNLLFTSDPGISPLATTLANPGMDCEAVTKVQLWLSPWRQWNITAGALQLLTLIQWTATEVHLKGICKYHV